MNLPTKRFADFVAAMSASWANSQNIQPVLPEGDPLLAIFESSAGQLLFAQAQIQLVAALARAQTSTGPDLDTFYGQFGFLRLGGTAASGQETFGSYTPAANNITIPNGTVVQSPGGGITYEVVADTTNPNYSPTLNGYVLAAGQTTVSVTISATSTGIAFNVAAGQLTQLAAAIPGIGYVTNASAISNGINPESDTAFSARFPLWLNSLSKATQAAIVSAILGVQQGIDYNLIENQNLAGQTQYGEFIAVIDNGTGSPPSSLITAVETALQNVRAFTVDAQTVAVTEVLTTIVIVIRVSAGYVASTIQLAVQAAIVAAVNANPIGSTLFVSTVEGAALTTVGVGAVQVGTTLNGVNSNLSVTALQAARTTDTDVTVNTF